MRSNYSRTLSQIMRILNPNASIAGEKESKSVSHLIPTRSRKMTGLTQLAPQSQRNEDAIVETCLPPEVNLHGILERVRSSSTVKLSLSVSWRTRKKLTNSSKRKQTNLKTSRATNDSRTHTSLTAQRMNQKMQSQKGSSILWTWWKRCSKAISPYERPYRGSQSSLMIATLRSSSSRKRTKISERGSRSWRSTQARTRWLRCRSWLGRSDNWRIEWNTLSRQATIGRSSRKLERTLTRKCKSSYPGQATTGLHKKEILRHSITNSMTTTSPCVLWWSTQANSWAKHTTTKRCQAKPQHRARRSSRWSEVCNQIKRWATTLRQVKRCSKSRRIKNKRIWTCLINSELLIKARRRNPRINGHHSRMHNQLIALEFHGGLQGRCLGTWLKPGLRNSNHQEEVATLEPHFQAVTSW